MGAMALGLLGGCSTSAERIEYVPALRAPAVEVLELGGLYNVTLVRGARTMMVDTGPPGSFEDLSIGLRSIGLEPSDIALVVLTHGHSDHAGNARELQSHGAAVLAHEGDVPMLREGDHGPLYATNLEAVLAQPAVGSSYPAVEPDLVLEGGDPYRLHGLGFDAEVWPVGAHTRGSIVVRLGNGGVLLGDLIRSGWLAGKVEPNTPATHLFHAHPVVEHQELAEAFVRRVAGCADVKTLFVGHGGPIDPSSLRDWAGDEVGRCPW